MLTKYGLWLIHLKGVNLIGCKWAFKKKIDVDGNVQTYKARLVAKGFKQIHGVDYDETFREINGRGDIHRCKVHTNDNVADPLTKALSHQKHESHISSIGI